MTKRRKIPKGFTKIEANMSDPETTERTQEEIDAEKDYQRDTDADDRMVVDDDPVENDRRELERLNQERAETEPQRLGDVLPQRGGTVREEEDPYRRLPARSGPLMAAGKPVPPPNVVASIANPETPASDADRFGQVSLPNTPDANPTVFGQVDRTGAALRGAAPSADYTQPQNAITDPALIAMRRLETARQASQGKAPSQDLTSTREFYAAQRVQLIEEVGAIEQFLGFTEHAEEIAVRIAKIELFLGLKA